MQSGGKRIALEGVWMRDNAWLISGASITPHPNMV
jgi:hypothetical protein